MVSICQSVLIDHSPYHGPGRFISQPVPCREPLDLRILSLGAKKTVETCPIYFETQNGIHLDPEFPGRRVTISGRILKHPTFGEPRHWKVKAWGLLKPQSFSQNDSPRGRKNHPIVEDLLIDIG